jgi:hypothetical protein
MCLNLDPHNVFVDATAIINGVRSGLRLASLR